VAGGQAAGEVKVRPLTGRKEYAAAVELQREIWRFDDLELLPTRLFVVASHIGGQILGAFDGRRMAGFLLAIPGRKADGEAYLHSHMLGVLPEYQNRGVGLALKLAQRDDARARRIRLIEWTFDPFNAKNAYFNLERLGAVVTGYIPNMYGSTTSPLHGGLPTDRCVAQWNVASSRRAQAARGLKTVVLIPAERTVPSQRSLARRMQRALKAGLAATGFERTGEAGSYLMEPWPRK
jgi:predicted GNAT superfamily acetyltransferase